MAISYLNHNVDWSLLKRNKKEWALLFGVGIPISILFNAWLYGLPPWRIGIHLYILGITASWGIAFAFVGGITAFNADFVEQAVMTILGGYAVLFSMNILGVLLGYSFFPRFGFFPSLTFFWMSLAYPFALVMGFIPGYYINHLLDKYVVKTSEKEVEANDYIDYRILD